MKRWVYRWNGYWFPQYSTTDLALCRILTVAIQLFLFFPSLRFGLNALQKNPAFIYPQLIIRGVVAVVPREVLFSFSGFTALSRVTQVAGIAALVGLCTRFSLFVFSLGIWILIAHRFSYAEVHHSEVLFSIFLMSLSFTPAGDRLSLDALLRGGRAHAAKETNAAPRKTETAMWSFKLAHVLLAMAYLSTATSKMIVGGLAWLNGYTLQAYILHDAVFRNISLGLWVAQYRLLCVGLSVYAVLFESTFFVSLFLPRAAPFFFVNALLFHIALHLTAGHYFFPHMALLVILIFFYNPSWWHTRWTHSVLTRNALFNRSVLND